MKDSFHTLSELMASVSRSIKSSHPASYWIIGETSDVRNNKNGHCYLELIEKDTDSGVVKAKARAYIWGQTYQMLRIHFEEQTGQAFTSGIKVLVNVSVDYHIVYGLGLNILDIDPSYTLGDIQRQRQEILNQLKEEGILTLNKELLFPFTPQRIAVITSPTAAGYEDFMNHLIHNNSQIVFYTHLFPAIMQGEQTESSIIQCLEQIYKNQESFDVVVIIRGGGASSDLAAFDSYLLASHCAQFPLPIISGIGHERDNSILDEVAYYRAKTPTAAADYLIDYMEAQYQTILLAQESIFIGIEKKIEKQDRSLQQLARQLPILVNKSLVLEEYRLGSIKENIRKANKIHLQEKENQLKEMELFLSLSSPEYILSKGYSITYKNGEAITSATQIKAGDKITTVLHKGKISSTVIKD
ncbi:exodeoxyribonuclease VII large subunit [Bacteroidales bacterium OttesenSCG-928-M11]|nr:exodeoxyribonuclease VII large subunit [Bacteroidales bacterium OttesenSCG-928-M11]